MGSTRPTEIHTEAARRHHRKMRALQLFWFAWAGGFFLYALGNVAGIVLDGGSFGRFLFQLVAAVLQITSLGLAARSWRNTTAAMAELRAIESEIARLRALG